LSLAVKEIYPAIIGEGIDSGWPGLLIRLAGCRLKCSYCDTRYAWKGGTRSTVRKVMREVLQQRLHRVLLTGGEPLEQEDSIELLETLVGCGHEVVLETSGAVLVRRVPQRVHIIMDLKTPGSGREQANLYQNLDHLKPGDEIKFVLCDLADYCWAKDRVQRLGLADRFAVNFSPARGRLGPARLAKWMIGDKLNFRLNLQLHRVIFPGKTRGI